MGCESAFSAVVVGAGVAGLVAARALTLNGWSVTVLEAKEHVGGRAVTSLLETGGTQRWCPGAELMHSGSSVLSHLVSELGLVLEPVFVTPQGDGGPLEEPVNSHVGLYFDGSCDAWLRHNSYDKEFVHLNSVLSSLQTVEQSVLGDATPDMSLRHWLREYMHVSERMLAMADAGYANTLAAPLDSLSLKGCVQLEQCWASEQPGDARLDAESLDRLLQHLYDQVEDIRFGTPVTSIRTLEHQANDLSRQHFCEVQYQTPDTSPAFLHVAGVVVTVPLPVLRSNAIEFHPALPTTTENALHHIGFSAALKAVLQLSEPCWSDIALDGIVCAQCEIPEFMIFEKGDGSGPVTVEAFATAHRASALVAKGREGLWNAMLNQLERMFGLDPKPKYIEGSFDMFDWASNLYCQGGYSYPHVHSRCMQKREHLASPRASGSTYVQLAGEHAHKHCMTLHAASESGECAANRLMRACS